MDTIMQHPRCHPQPEGHPSSLLNALTATPGATLDSDAVAISCHQNSLGLGLSAKIDLPAEHLLFSIPTTALIGSNPSTHLPAPIRDPLLAHPSNAMANPTIHLAVTLLYLALSTKASLPLCDAYIAALPTTVQSPAYLSTESIQTLPSHFPAFDHAKDIHAALANLFSSEDDDTDPPPFGRLLLTLLAPLLLPCADLDSLFRYFVWAYAMVESRAFRPFASTTPDLPVLVPFADLMNHSSLASDVNVKYKLTRGGTLRFVTCRPVTACEPLVLKYNDLSNAQELVYYGFAQRDNPYPDPIPLCLPPLEEQNDGPGRAIKHALLVDAPPIGNLALSHAVSDPASAANVLLSARVHVATVAELRQGLHVWDPTRTGQVDLTVLVQGVNEDNNARAYKLMARAIADLKHKLTEGVDLEVLPTDACRDYVKGVWRQVNDFIEYFDLNVPCIDV